MGRPESALDPTAGPKENFANELRKLRRNAGNLSYRRMAARAAYSATALSTAASGKTFPSWEVTKAFITACGADEQYWVQRWATARQTVASTLSSTSSEPPTGHLTTPSGQPVPSPPEDGGRPASGRQAGRHWLTWPTVVFGIVCLAGWAVVGLLMATRPASTATSPGHSLFLGLTDMSGYCHSEGYAGVSLDGRTAYDWHCTRAPNVKSGISVTESCRWKYHDAKAVARYDNFHDPSSWQCWGSVENLGQIDVTGYCQAQGYATAVARGATVDTWSCASADGQWATINPDAACRWQFGAQVLVATVGNFNAPLNYWDCWG